MTNPEGSSSSFQQEVLDRLEALKRSDDELNGKFTQLDERFTQLDERFTQLDQKVDRFNDRFSAYQQGTQWVVQLAFTLIASATLTVIITSVLRR